MVMARNDLMVACILCLSFAVSNAANAENTEATKEPADSKVHVIEYEHFWRFLDRHPLVLMEFYAPWCGHCQELAPKYREAASILATADLPRPVVLAKYDDSTESQRRLRGGAEDVFNYNAYPALIVFENGKHTKYTGGREAKDIVLYMSAISKGLDPHDEEAKLRPGLYKDMADYDPNVFMELEPETFESAVLTEKDAIWIVEFYSDHCPFCKSLAPELLKAARASIDKHAGKVRFGGLNTRIFSDVGKKFNITGFPWVSCFYQGEKTDDMAGLGGADSVINWANKKIEDHNPSGASAAPVSAASSDAEIRSESSASEVEANYTTEELTYGGLQSTGNLSWREILGQHTWFFLHTVAAKYPDHPTEADQQAVRYLFAALGQHYPCKVCRHNLQRHLLNGPPGPIRTQNRKELSTWICELHNVVSKENGKPEFDCNPFKLDLIYLKDCGECKTDPKTGEVYKGTGGPWNAELWAKDPVGYQEIKSQADMWRKEELEDLLNKAKDYNVMAAKKIKMIREAIRQGEITEDEAIQNLAEKLEPILKLESKVRRLERK